MFAFDEKGFCIGLASAFVFIAGFFRATDAFKTKNSRETDLKDRWIAAKFDGKIERTILSGACLEVVCNYFPVFPDNCAGAKLRIGDRCYNCWLFYRASSRINVFLSKPCKRFLAEIGVDTNSPEATRGNGTIRFSITSNGTKLFQSGVLRGAEPGVPVDVALDGAKSFSMIIDDDGDGISCDQADWTDARVEFKDGELLYLSDLPFVDRQVYDRTLDVDFPFSFVYDGRSSRIFLKDWKLVRELRGVADGKVNRTPTFTEPNVRLQVVCSVVDCVDYPFVEWTLNFRNLLRIQTRPLLKTSSRLMRFSDAISSNDAF